MKVNVELTHLTTKITFNLKLREDTYSSVNHETLFRLFSHILLRTVRLFSGSDR